MSQPSGQQASIGNSATITSGSGAPTGVYAGKGSLYVRVDTGASTSATRLYVNGTGDSTWVAITTAS